jgi:HlyD family secretion protein
MFTRRPDIFRSKALERLASPEALDQLMFSATAREWLPLLTIGALIVLVGAWTTLGTIPISVSGRTVLVYPSNLVEIQSTTAGRLETLTIREGDVVKAGAVVGRVDQSAVARQLQEDRAALADLRGQDRLKAALQNNRASVQQQENDSERRLIDLQAQTLRKNLNDAETMNPILKGRLAGYQNLLKEGLIAEFSNDLVVSQQSVLDNAARIVDLKTRIEQLDGQLKQIATREATFASDSDDEVTARTNPMRDLASRIALNELLLQRDSEVRTLHSGRVIALAVASGQVVSAGTRIAILETDNRGKASVLTSVSFFPVGDGKRIRPGMPVQVTPDSVERQRYGGIVGKVTSVSGLPVTKASAALLVGSSEVVEALLSGGPYIQVVSELETDAVAASGYKWSSSSGPGLPITPGTVGSTRVTIEGRAPITYLFPFLRSASGIF